MWLAGGDREAQYNAPASSATMDITPRRCQRFKPAPGEKYRWTSTALPEGKVIQSGTATADRWGLVTLTNVTVTKGRHKIEISKGLP